MLLPLHWSHGIALTAAWKQSRPTVLATFTLFTWMPAAPFRKYQICIMRWLLTSLEKCAFCRRMPHYPNRLHSVLIISMPTSVQESPWKILRSTPICLPAICPGCLSRTSVCRSVIISAKKNRKSAESSALFRFYLHSDCKLFIIFFPESFYPDIPALCRYDPKNNTAVPSTKAHGKILLSQNDPKCMVFFSFKYGKRNADACICFSGIPLTIQPYFRDPVIPIFFLLWILVNHCVCLSTEWELCRIIATFVKLPQQNFGF